MKFLSSSILFILCILCMNCQQKTAPKKRINQVNKLSDNTIIFQNTSSDFLSFLTTLIDTQNLHTDDNWKKNISADNIDVALTIPPISDESPDTIHFVFPFTDIKMSYHAVRLSAKNLCEFGSQFTINNYELPVDKDCQRLYPVITPVDIHRFIYKHTRFITMTGCLADYNGYGDRVRFNYFFDISTPQPVQDIYTNFVLVYRPPPQLLYGDLNNDTLLDRIVYDGIEYPYCNDTCMITISAETYKDKKWQPLRDSQSRPYYIQVHTDGNMNKYTIVKYNWMRSF